MAAAQQVVDGVEPAVAPDPVEHFLRRTRTLW